MASETLTETEATRFFVQPKENEHLSTLLKRCIPTVQTKRARAYNRLEDALRKSEAASPTRPAVSPPQTHRETVFPIGRGQDYATVCANVTEDLKLCSEAVLELRSVLVHHSAVEGPLRETDTDEIDMVIKWLDQLQELEERKLVATVSRHVLLRSMTSSALITQKNALGTEEMKEKIGKYVREVSDVHEMINEILQEMREYFLEHEDQQLTR